MTGNPVAVQFGSRAGCEILREMPERFTNIVEFCEFIECKGGGE